MPMISRPAIHEGSLSRQLLYSKYIKREQTNKQKDFDIQCTSMPPPSRSQLLSCFIGSNLVALGAGTPYLYSFYAPQLLSKCQIPISKSSFFSFAMTIGSSALGFLAGVIIDKKSPRFSCLVGAICTFVAYTILHHCYVNELSNAFILSGALILVGFGSISGFYAAVKCCTTNFPRHRGTAGAFPVSLYALAGLLYSFLCEWLFGDNMALVFKFLKYVCTIMILVGFFTLRILVGHTTVKKRRRSSILQQPGSTTGLNENANPAQPIAIEFSTNKRDSRGSFTNYKSIMKRSMSQISSSTESLLSIDSTMRRTDSYVWSKELAGSLSFWGWGKYRPSGNSLNAVLSSTPPQLQSEAQLAKTSPSSSSGSTSVPPILLNNKRDSFSKPLPASLLNQAQEPLEEIGEHLSTPGKSWKDNHVYQTIKNPNFIACYLTLATLQGIGQLYIYSVGFIVRTQVNSTPELHLNAEKIQSLQVSIISVMSFLGRLSSGPVSDLLVKKIKAQRAWCILVACTLMFFASRQIVAPLHDPLVDTKLKTPPNIRNISVSSVLFGYAFGVTFGTYPAIIADLFGTDGFSTIWGLCVTGGLISVKLLSSVLAQDLSSNTESGQKTCLKGSLCYKYTFGVTAVCSLFAGVLVCATIGTHYWSKLKERRKLKGILRQHGEGNAVFLLEDDESFAEDDENELHHRNLNGETEV